MRAKQLNRLAIVGLFSFLILAGVAFAQNYNTAFQPLIDLFDFILNDLGQNIVFRKFLIWMLLFSVLVMVVPNLPFIGDSATEKKQAKIIALILSLIMSLGIPNVIINLIFDEYSLVGALALYLLVPVLLFLATKDMQNPAVKGVVFIITGLLLGILALNASNGSWGRSLQQFVNWMYIGSSICLLVGIFLLFSGLGGGGGDNGGQGRIRNALGNMFNRRGARGRRNPGRIFTPGSAAPTQPPASGQQQRDQLMNVAFAAVGVVFQRIHTQLITAGNNHLINNMAAIRDQNQTAISQNNTFATNFLNILNQLVQTDFPNAINAINAVYNDPSIASIPNNQANALTQLENNLISYANDIADYYSDYSRRLGRAQGPGT